MAKPLIMKDYGKNPQGEYEVYVGKQIIRQGGRIVVKNKFTVNLNDPRYDILVKMTEKQLLAIAIDENA